jgi:hypothetical protein
MRQFTADEIQKRFEKLPAEVQIAVTSTEVNGKIEEIAKKHNLLIDEEGELVDEIGLVMLGLVKSSDFVDHIVSRCSIDENTALDIAHDVNTEVFSAIKQQMMQIEEIEEKNKANVNQYKDSNLSDLERVGNFKILAEGNNRNENASENSSEKEIPNKVSRIGVAKNVENIQNDNLLQSPAIIINEPAIVERKFTPQAPQNLPTENVSGKIPERQNVMPKAPVAPPIPKKNYTSDPYREPF